MGGTQQFKAKNQALEAFQIMLAGEYWLSKAMQALFRPDIFESMIASVHSSTTKRAAVKLLLTSGGICGWSCTRCMPRLT